MEESLEMREENEEASEPEMRNSALDRDKLQVSIYKHMYRVFHLKKFDSTLCLGDFL